MEKKAYEVSPNREEQAAFLQISGLIIGIVAFYLIFRYGIIPGMSDVEFEEFIADFYTPQE